jgi:cytochrome c oxidase assembly protein subunit 15
MGRSWHASKPVRSRIVISPALYSRVATVALAALALIVLTGAAVRMTGSGLGCPDWPKCYGRTVAPLESHAIIEYTNRLLSGFVGLAVIAAGVLAWFRRPFRWHLALFGGFLPVGVMAQGILGALVVKHHLAPGLVMSHFILSMILLDSAFALAWCARYEPGERGYSSDRLGVWAVRALVPIGQITILAGTIATASGPHAGSHGEQLVKRFDFRGSDTLHWVVQRHGAIAAFFGIALCAVWLLLHRHGGEKRALRPLTVTIALVALQGALGIVQYQAKLPAELVWVHVALATLTWLSVLWTVASAGRLAPRAAVAGDGRRTATPPEPELAQVG